MIIYDMEFYIYIGYGKSRIFFFVKVEDGKDEVFWIIFFSFIDYRVTFKEKKCFL